jgi:hypothetical protein
VAEEKVTGEKHATDNKFERLALDAVRKELTSKEADRQVLNSWNDLKTLAKDDADNRHWYLLAAQRHRELSEK